MVSENGPDRSKHQHQGDGLMTLTAHQAETAHGLQYDELQKKMLENTDTRIKELKPYRAY